MWNEPRSTALQISLLIGVYLLHSTLLMGGVWCLTRLTRRLSSAVREPLWKAAAVLPFVTAPLQQWGWSSHPPLLSWTVTLSELDDQSASSNQAPTGLQTRLPALDATPQPNELIEVDAGDLRDRSSLSDAAPPMAVPTIRPPTIPESSAATAHRPTASASPREDEIVEPDGPRESIASNVGANPLQPQSNATRTLAPFPATPPAPHRWFLYAVGFVLALAAFGLLRLVIVAILLQRRLQRTVETSSGPVRDCLDTLLRQRRIRHRVRLLGCTRIGEPAAYGVWRWSILIPHDLDERLERDELTALLAHELAHLVRRDTVWLWIGRTLCALVPWQPLNYLAVRRWRDEAEILCDAWAVEQGVAPLTMARSLAHVAEWRQGIPPTLGLTATGTRSALALRIEILAAGGISTGRSKQRLTASAAIMVIAGALSFVGPIPVNRPARAEDTTALPSSPLPQGGAERSPSQLAPPSGATDEPLDPEFQALLADLRQLDELLAAEDDSPEFQSARDSFHRRIAAFETQLNALIEVEPILTPPMSDPQIPSTASTNQESLP